MVFARPDRVHRNEHGPLLLFGADALGRDIFSRLLYGAGLSLGVTLAGVVGALVIGALVGALAGSAGGLTDSILMLTQISSSSCRAPTSCWSCAASCPKCCLPREVFLADAALFALAAWPHPARGVRAIVRTERTRDYAQAARAAGASPLRLACHLLPAAWGFLAIEIALLVPALLVAEATISFLGLGFTEPRASWGTMLQDAANVRVIDEAPWMLAPAFALFLVSRRAVPREDDEYINIPTSAKGSTSLSDIVSLCQRAPFNHAGVTLLSGPRRRSAARARTIARLPPRGMAALGGRASLVAALPS